MIFPISDIQLNDRVVFDCLSVEKRYQEAPITVLHDDLSYMLSTISNFHWQFPYINDNWEELPKAIAENQAEVISIASQLFYDSYLLDTETSKILQKTLTRTAKVQSSLAGRR